MPFVILFLLIVIAVILYSYSYKGDKKSGPKKGNNVRTEEDDPFNVVYFNEIKDAQETKEIVEEPEVAEAPETEE